MGRQFIEWIPPSYIDDKPIVIEYVEPEPPIPQFNVYDLSDNLLDTAFNMDEARQIFKDRYIYWEGSVDMFITEIQITENESRSNSKEIKRVHGNCYT